MKHLFNIQNHRIVNPGDLGGLHKDIVLRKSRDPCSRCKMDSEERAEACATGTIQKRDGLR